VEKGLGIENKGEFHFREAIYKGGILRVKKGALKVKEELENQGGINILGTVHIFCLREKPL